MANSVIALSLRLLTLLFLKSSKAVLIVSIAICSLGASLFVTLDVSDEVQHIPSAPRVTSVNSRRWNSLCCSNSAVQIVVCSQLFLFFFIYVQFVVSYTVLEQRFSSSCFAFQSLVPSQHQTRLHKSIGTLPFLLIGLRILEPSHQMPSTHRLQSVPRMLRDQPSSCNQPMSQSWRPKIRYPSNSWSR